MNKHWLYGGILVVVIVAVFAWWWTQPSKYIERITTLFVPAEETLFSQSDESGKVYLLKVRNLYVKKVIDGCELHGGSFASAEQTGAAGLSGNADFKTHGLFGSEHIGCDIKGTTDKKTWEFFVKDNLLYFKVSH